MAAHRKHPLPSKQLRETLSECRERGMSFDDAWTEAMGMGRRRGRVVWPHKTCERRGWREALAETRAEWEASYNHTHTPLSRALERALSLVREEDDAAVAAPHADERPIRLTFLPPPVGIGVPLKKQVAA